MSSGSCLGQSQKALVLSIFWTFRTDSKPLAQGTSCEPLQKSVPHDALDGIILIFLTRRLYKNSSTVMAHEHVWDLKGVSAVGTNYQPFLETGTFIPA